MTPRVPPHIHTKRLPRIGFTLIEVMVAVVVLILGVLAAFSMQIVAVRSNAAAKESTDAASIAEHFIERLRQDATAWSSASPADFSATTYLSPAMLAPNTWVVATSDGPVNPLGIQRINLSAPLSNQAEYCVAYRLAWAVQNQVLFGYVRVFWPQPRGSRSLIDSCATEGDISVDDMDDPSRQAAVLKELNLFTVPFTLRVTPTL